MLTVNSTAWVGADANPGNGTCETATGNGVCTLRAAIEESNALNLSAGNITIVVDNSIPLNTKMTGAPDNTANYMLSPTPATAAQDTYGAYFNVTAPVIIDLGHRLQVDGSASDNFEAAAFYLNGPDIQVRNADMVLSSGSSFVVGPLANQVTIDGDTSGGFGYINTNAPSRNTTNRSGL